MRRAFLAVIFGGIGACAIAGGSMGLAAAGTSGAIADGLRGAGQAPVVLLLFGGGNHEVFLGCLTCPEYDAGSVRNRLGLHGSAYSSMSILNPFGRFGSPSSALSPCNPYALHAPVIVDREGRSYGELTVSESNSRRTRIEFLRGWLAAVCRH